MEDKYTFETCDKREMDLIINRHRMVVALSELRDWYSSIYNGKEYDTCWLYKDKIYTSRELEENRDSFERDEDGFIKGLTRIYNPEAVLDRIRDILDGLWDFLERNM